jgi:AraC-like DNA-binding protein/TolB-like protein/Tfp pilus assembly protein PilF
MEGFLNKLTGIIEANLTNDQFGVSELARQMNMSRSSLHRKVKDAAGMTVSQFICRVRLRKSSELLQSDSFTVSETAFECGFHSVTYFTKCFRDFYGTSPGQFKKDEAHKISENANQTGIKKRWDRSSKMIRVVAGMLIFISTAALLYVSVFYSSERSPGDLSIGIYPFQYIGYESDRQYLAEGMKEAVLHHLSKIEDLRVVSLGNDRKSDVAYLLNGSYQEGDDNIHLNLRLTNISSGTQVWFNEYAYDQTDVFSLQSEIAQRVAGELNAFITPEEKTRIESIPTFSLTAYDFYLRGREEYRNHQMNNDNQQALLHAEQYYREALRYDPDFARAYAGLAMVYKNMNRGNTYFSEHFLDSMRLLADRALACDRNTDAAYTVKGLYYWYLGDEEKALDMYNKALQLNPNSWEAYRGKGTLFLVTDPFQSIQNYLQAASLVDGANLEMILKELLYPYLWAGFVDEAERCNKEALRLFGDSLIYYAGLGAIESQQGNFAQAAEYYQ